MGTTLHCPVLLCFACNMAAVQTGRLFLPVKVIVFITIFIVGWSLKIGILSPFAAGCPGGPTVGSSWDTTEPNTNATGQCDSGFFSPSNPQRFCNLNGTWEEIENDCVDSPLGQAADWLPFVISGVVGAASVITYFFARKRNPAAQNSIILGTGFSLVELFTDCLFLLQTSMLIGSFNSFSFFFLLVMFMVVYLFFLSFLVLANLRTYSLPHWSLCCYQ